MRTTITLDDDVAAKLQAERRKSGRSLRETVNYFLRLGLTARPRRRGKKFTVRNVGLSVGHELESAAELIERLEGPLHR